MTPTDRSQDGTASRDHAVLLDLLRGLASVWVLLVHTRGISFVELGALPPEQQTFVVKVVLGLTRSGREAVLTFFVLSGYLVGGQLIARVMRGDFNLTDYAIDRCSRILLPLIPACLVTAAINVSLLNTPDSPWNVIGSMVGLNGVVVLEPEHNLPLWTLAYEIWFYILGGALAYLIATYRQRVSLTTVFILGLSVVVFTILQADLLLFWMLGGLMVLCVRVPYRKIIGLRSCWRLLFRNSAAVALFATTGGRACRRWRGDLCCRRLSPLAGMRWGSRARRVYRADTVRWLRRQHLLLAVSDTLACTLRAAALSAQGVRDRCPITRCRRPSARRRIARDPGLLLALRAEASAND